MTVVHCVNDSSSADRSFLDMIASNLGGKCINETYHGDDHSGLIDVSEFTYMFDSPNANLDAETFTTLISAWGFNV